jgi:predicted acetyltransferase
MSFEFKRGTKDDWPQMNWVWAMVYEGKPPTEDLDPEPDNRTRVLVKDDGKVVSVCQIIDYQMARGDVDLPCGGIGGVATLVEARRSGAATVLMEETIRYMHGQGKLISALYAFKESYYRKFGYETCGWRWQFKAPTHRLPDINAELPLRQIKPEDAIQLATAYDAMIRQFSGSHQRDDKDWKRRLGKQQTIYAVGDPVEGYFWSTFTEEFWKDIKVKEMGWSTARGYRSVMAGIKSLCSNQSNVTWCEPPNSPFLANYLNQGIKVEMDEPTMFRVINVPECLKAIAPKEADFDFTIGVTDDVIPSNHGSFRGTTGPEGAAVEPGGEPDFEIDMRSLSQAVMGSPSLANLADLGVIRVRSAAGLDQATRFFGSKPVICMEFF